jgi:single-strand DNA-binding protein
MSSSLASIVLIGRLTKDAELKAIPSGEFVVHFSLATDSRVKKDGQWTEEPSFWDVDFFGKRAESVNPYLTKGKLISVTGPVKIEKWNKDGKDYMKVKVNASDVVLLGGNVSASEQKPQKSGQGEAMPGKSSDRVPGGNQEHGNDFQDDDPTIPF